MDKPTGSLLLLFPCLWGLAFAYSGTHSLYAVGYIAVLFTVGSFVMRGAGCVWNDIMDADIDCRVARTATRPIPAGDISKRRALLFLCILLGIGFCVLVCLSIFSDSNMVFVLGISSLLLVAIYPLAKRITYFPQVWLGLTFNWGALMGWAVMRGGVELPAITLYIAGIFWTLGYDTIYAHQDKEDDLIVGVKSTAIYFGNHTKFALSIFYGMTIAMLGMSGYLVGVGLAYYITLIIPAFHLVYQIQKLDIDNPTSCLKLFNANKWFGLLILLVIIMGKIL